MRPTPACIALLASAAFAGNVRVVGPAPAPYLTIQDAIAESADGDVILVKSGTYSSLRVHQKGIAIVADVGAIVNVSSAARITGLNAAQTVSLSGLRCAGAYSAGLPELACGLSAVNNVGQVLAQDSTFTGFIGVPGACTNAKAPPGVQLQASSGSFVSCTLRGGRHDLVQGDGPAQGDAIYVRSNGRVSCDQVQLFGGQGGARCSSWDEAGGGSGATFETGAAHGFFSSCQIQGGNGNWLQTPCFPQAAPGSGGHGIVTYAPVYRIAGTLNGGLGGQYGGSCCQGLSCPTYNGWPMLGGGTLTNLPGTARTLRGPSVVRDSQAVTLTFVGAAGEVADLSVDVDGLIHQFDAAQSGVLHVNPAKPWRPMGTVPANGTLQVSFKLPKLRPHDPGRVWFMQARFRQPVSGSTRLANAWVIAQVDSGY